MIEVHKVTSRLTQCTSCKKPAKVRIVADDYTSCNPINICLCEECTEKLKKELEEC